MMNNKVKQARWAVPILSVVAGMVVWWGIGALVRDVDPMQHKEYLVVGYPLLLVSSVILGSIYGARAWQCGIWMFGAQFLIGIVTIKTDLNLWPLGILIFAALAAPCSGLALIGYFLRKKIFGAR